MNSSAFITLGQASLAYKKSKSTISKDLKSGKLSFKEKTKSGYKIDKAELDRVYGNSHSKRTHGSNGEERFENADITVLKTRLEAKEYLIERMQNEIDDLRDRVKDLSKERDDWKKQADAQTRMLAHRSNKKNWFNFLGA